VQTINLLSPLPVITAAGVFINGSTEPGSSPGAVLVQLNGASAGSAANGLEFSGANGEVVALTIDSFGQSGIQLDSGANSTQIYACFLGVNPSGTAALANGRNGLDIFSNNNTVGAGGNFGNVISGNGGNGGGAQLNFDPGASGNEVLGNSIGTNAAGTASLFEFGSGIVDGGSSNTIGQSGAGNLISGNAQDGIFFDGQATGDLIQGNFIGTNAAGTSALANGGSGIDQAFANNTIGGSSAGTSNLIAGNHGDGILLAPNASGNLVQGNNVGLNVHGGILGNGFYGFGVFFGSTNNTLGGTTAGAANNFSGNKSDGIYLGGDSNTVLGNNIEHNAANGIEIIGNSNTIGGATTAARNVISLNVQDGVLLDSGGAGNVVEGDDIGTNASGTTAQGNGANGIEIAGSSNQIGSDSGTHNVISANAQDGVLIDSGTRLNLVTNSFIGTNNAGSAALGNSANGVEILSSDNEIFSETGLRTVISGNGSDGVLLSSSATGNIVAGAFIGTNAAGTGSLANSANGVEVLGTNNFIGTTLIDIPGLRNVISGNAEDGVLLGSGATGNFVQTNFIGTNAAGTAALANSASGV
jgi:hypothetical protein